MTSKEIAELKLECLKIAAESLPHGAATPTAVLEAAQKMFDFVMGN